MADAKVTVYLTAQDAFSSQLDAFKRKMGEVAGGMSFTTSASGRWEEGLRRLAAQQAESTGQMVKGVTAGAEWKAGLDKASGAVTNLAGNLLGANNQVSNIAEGLLAAFGAGGPVIGAIAVGLGGLALLLKEATSATDVMTKAFQAQQKAIGDVIAKWTELGDSEFDQTKRGLELQKTRIQAQIKYLEVLTLTNQERVKDLIDANKALITVNESLDALAKKRRDALDNIPKAPLITWAEGVKASLEDLNFAIDEVLRNGARLGRNLGPMPGDQTRQGASEREQAAMQVAAEIQGPSLAMQGAGGDRGTSDYARAMQEKLQAALLPLVDIVTQFGNDLSEAISDAFATAFTAGDAGKALDSFGKAMLAGIGGIFTAMGKTYLKFGLIMKPLVKALYNPLTSAWASTAIGLALMALGKSLHAMAEAGGGGGEGGGTRTVDYSNDQEKASKGQGRRTIEVDGKTFEVTPAGRAVASAAAAQAKMQGAGMGSVGINVPESLGMNPLHPSTIQWMADAFTAATGVKAIILSGQATERFTGRTIEIDVDAFGARA